jgi:hypothetical protein
VGDCPLKSVDWRSSQSTANRALASRRWGTDRPAVLHGQSPSQLSPGPQRIDHLGPDGRCQAVPVCDQLVECRTLPAHFRPGFSHHVVTTLKADNCGTRASGAIPAASTFSVQASTCDSKRQDSSNFPDGSGVATNADRRHLRQGATANGGTRPGYATESATSSLNDDPDLAVVVAAWSKLPEAVRDRIVAMIKATTV